MSMCQPMAPAAWTMSACCHANASAPYCLCYCFSLLPPAFVCYAQKPFMPLGTLRQQLLFPAGWKQQRPESHINAASSDKDADSCTIVVADSNNTDLRLQELLQSVQLGHLLYRFKAGLDAEVDWPSILSLGEQQRVAMVRLLYHKPDLAFLVSRRGINAITGFQGRSFSLERRLVKGHLAMCSSHDIRLRGQRCMAPPHWNLLHITWCSWASIPTRVT